jgi:hypothetical protein
MDNVRPFPLGSVPHTAQELTGHSVRFFQPIELVPCSQPPPDTELVPTHQACAHTEQHWRQACRPTSYPAEQAHASDGLQRPLRSRFQPRLMPGIRLQVFIKAVRTSLGVERQEP